MLDINTDYRGVLISGVNVYYKAQFGTFVSVLNTGVSSFHGILNRGVSLQLHIHSYVCKYIHAYITYIHTYIIYIHTYIHTYIYIYVLRYIYT